MAAAIGQGNALASTSGEGKVEEGGAGRLKARTNN